MAGKRQMWVIAKHHFKETNVKKIVIQDKAKLVKEYRPKTDGLNLKIQRRPVQQLKPDDPIF